MSTETYRNVVTLEQHLAFVATRQAARALQESLDAGALRKLSLAELEQLVSELSALISEKLAREKEYATMTAEELTAVLRAVSDEVKRRKGELSPKKPIGPTSAPQPTMSKVSKAKEAAPPSGAALAAALEQIAEAVRRGH